MSLQRKPTIVFCHGIWADGSCFNKVIPALQKDGHEVIAVQYGLDSFEEDVATVKRTLNRVGSPVILVGHSYGGATITAAGVDERVVGLVYIAVSYGNKTESLECHFRGDRERIRQWAAQQALDLIRRRLM